MILRPEALTPTSGSNPWRAESSDAALGNLCSRTAAFIGSRQKPVSTFLAKVRITRLDQRSSTLPSRTVKMDWRECRNKNPQGGSAGSMGLFARLFARAMLRWRVLERGADIAFLCSWKCRYLKTLVFALCSSFSYLRSFLLSPDDSTIDCNLIVADPHAEQSYLRWHVRPTFIAFFLPLLSLSHRR